MFSRKKPSVKTIHENIAYADYTHGISRTLGEFRPLPSRAKRLGLRWQSAAATPLWRE
jgi:hypothetical protein